MRRKVDAFGRRYERELRRKRRGKKVIKIVLGGGYYWNRLCDMEGRRKGE